MPTILKLTALEILDSRGNPTLQATCELVGGRQGTASVPSGASTGRAEAHELRDGDPARYAGLGCRQAVGNVNGEIHAALRARSYASQRELDQALVALDGTPDKSRLGANALLAVSLAFARASAAELAQPLYVYLAAMLNQAPRNLPRPTINLFSGGKHAGAQVSIQDVLVVPASTRTMDQTLAMTAAVYRAAAALCLRKYGMRALTADEGGLAPPFPASEAMLQDAVESIQAAGFEPGRDVALAVDLAASHFYHAGRYHLDQDELTGLRMIERLLGWLERYPIVSLEDGLAEEDWEHWPALRAGVAGRALVLGDDLLCTNPARIRQAIDAQAADALLLKVNQIGTLSQAADAYRLARGAGWRVTISARSGETEDHWLADLAVGWGGDQIKVGSITQSERLAKYNRLLAIEAETGLPLVGWPAIGSF
jgi:enolase